MTTAVKQKLDLSDSETQLRSLAAKRQQRDFFELVVPKLGPLRAYLKRRLRIAYVWGVIRPGLLNSQDLLDEVVVEAYERFAAKPQNLSLEEWLYQIANKVLDKYLKETEFEQKNRVSIERIKEKELSQLDEHMTANAEGKPMLTKDLDPNDYPRSSFTPPGAEDPREFPEGDEAEFIARHRRDLLTIVRTLATLPVEERVVFELIGVEGLSPKGVSLITGVPERKVKEIAARVRTDILNALHSEHARVQASVR
jgi:RNA polymerase sigma factor (sigma-70 family)